MLDYTPRPRTPAIRVQRMDESVVPLPKASPWRCEAYLRAVARLPCIHCGKVGASQAAHSDTSKGMGIKAPDWTAVPLCADEPGRRGCHSLLGASGVFTQDQRRTLERNYIQRTQTALRVEGLWKDEWIAAPNDQEAPT